MPGNKESLSSPLIPESNASAHSTPCVNTVLVLRDEDGKDVLRSQTDAQGRFIFYVENNRRYFLRPLSEHYLIRSEHRAWTMGDEVFLKLRVR